ncbi:MAG: type IV toxin-antitoxin system AbiEi family antitoxin domain-containing protein [Planctomycetota bacterium]
MTDAVERAISIFRKNRGMLRAAQAVEAGVHRNTLYGMLESGVVERLTRGLYRLTEIPPLSTPDLVAVSQKIPQGVICLVSALAYHELTTQIPHVVHVAVARNSRPPSLRYPPIRVFRFSGASFCEGIDRVEMDGATVRIYNPEKTLADCFKYRNRIGMNTALEALRFYKERGRVDVESLLRYAQVCRVAQVMRPYLEALL